MNMKKFIMIIVLVGFLISLGIVLVQINNDSTEKNNNSSSNQNSTMANNGENTSQSYTSEMQITSVDDTQVTAKVRGCTEKVEPDMDNILEITDNYFIEQTNDLYLNLSDYIGRTIKIEGFVSWYEEANGDVCYAVIRNSPGCCGNDGVAGVDIRYDGEYPAEDTWVEVIGVVGKDTVYDSVIPAIQVSSITPKEEGVTFVTN